MDIDESIEEHEEDKKAKDPCGQVDVIVINDAIEELTKTEGSTVTFLSEDPEAFGGGKTIECCGDWTNWVDRRFLGSTWENCLSFALKEKQAWVSA